MPSYRTSNRSSKNSYFGFSQSITGWYSFVFLGRMIIGRKQHRYGPRPLSLLACPLIGSIKFSRYLHLSRVQINDESDTEDNEEDEEEESTDGFDDAVNDIDEMFNQPYDRTHRKFKQGKSKTPTDEEWHHKAELLINRVNEVSRHLCVRPGFALSIDEMMKLFKGRSGDTVRMRSKPIKEGF